MISLLSSEWLKTKRTGIRWLAFLLPPSLFSGSRRIYCTAGAAERDRDLSALFLLLGGIDGADHDRYPCGFSCAGGGLCR